MGRTYRTMQGREVDMQALKTKHELTQAVGNVRMNARGDMLDAFGKIIKTKEQLASEGLVANSSSAAAAQRSAPQADNISSPVVGDDEFDQTLSEAQALEVLSKAKKKK